MNHDPRESAGEQPRSEPEIIAPPRSGSRSRSDREMWVASDRHGMHRIYVAKLGPSGLIMLSLGVVLFVVCVLFLLAGALLIWIPIAAILVVGSIVAAFLRKFLRE
jgi:Flp pilus assembly protein TadB